MAASASRLHLYRETSQRVKRQRVSEHHQDTEALSRSRSFGLATRLRLSTERLDGTLSKLRLLMNALRFQSGRRRFACFSIAWLFLVSISGAGDEIIPRRLLETEETSQATSLAAEFADRLERESQQLKQADFTTESDDPGSGQVDLTSTLAADSAKDKGEIGRASCRERV